MSTETERDGILVYIGLILWKHSKTNADHCKPNNARLVSNIHYLPSYSFAIFVYCFTAVRTLTGSNAGTTVGIVVTLVFTFIG